MTPSPTPLTKAKPLGEKMSLEWGSVQAEKLWSNLYAKYKPVIFMRRVLDLGCSWGYMLKYLTETHKPKHLFGVDVAALWQDMKPLWDYEKACCPVTFLQEDIRENTSIPEESLDLVLCSSVFQYMPPDMLEGVLDKLLVLLKPGGELLLRTRCFTSSVGEDFHTHFSLPFIHLLHPGRETARAYLQQTGRPPRYLNTLTASTYAALFHRCGFEILDFTRRMNKSHPAIRQKVAEKWPWIGEEELNVAEVEARLLRPMGPEQLHAFGKVTSRFDVLGRAQEPKD